MKNLKDYLINERFSDNINVYVENGVINIVTNSKYNEFDITDIIEEYGSPLTSVQKSFPKINIKSKGEVTLSATELKFTTITCNSSLSLSIKEAEGCTFNTTGKHSIIRINPEGTYESCVFNSEFDIDIIRDKFRSAEFTSSFSEFNARVITIWNRDNKWKRPDKSFFTNNKWTIDEVSGIPGIYDSNFESLYIRREYNHEESNLIILTKYKNKLNTPFVLPGKSKDGYYVEYYDR